MADAERVTGGASIPHPKANAKLAHAARQALHRALRRIGDAITHAHDAADTRHEFAGNAKQEIEAAQRELDAAASALDRSTLEIRRARAEHRQHVLDLGGPRCGSPPMPETDEPINQFRERSARYAAKRDA